MMQPKMLATPTIGIHFFLVQDSATPYSLITHMWPSLGLKKRVAIYVTNRSSSLKSLEAIVLGMKRKSNSEPMIINDVLGLASHSENKESDTIFSIAIG